MMGQNVEFFSLPVASDLRVGRKDMVGASPEAGSPDGAMSSRILQFVTTSKWSTKELLAFGPFYLPSKQNGKFLCSLGLFYCHGWQ